MPRKFRLEYAGARYQVMSRGDQREDIFLGDVDRHDFIKTLAKGCQGTDWQMHVICRLEEMAEPALEEVRPGWSIGSDVFRRECLEGMEGKVGENHPGQLDWQWAVKVNGRFNALPQSTEAGVARSGGKA